MTASARDQNRLTTTGSAPLSCWTDATVVSARRGGILMNSRVLLAVSLFVPASLEIELVTAFAPPSSNETVGVVAAMWFLYL